MSIDYTRIIVRPLISEKGSLFLKENIYSFEVARTANKNEIAEAVESIFKVKVEKVRTANARGKRKQKFGRAVSKVPYFKKAYVQVAEGQKIKIFEGV